MFHLQQRKSTVHVCTIVHKYDPDPGYQNSTLGYGSDLFSLINRNNDLQCWGAESHNVLI